MRHNNATLFELVAITDVLGEEGLRAVIAGRPIEPVKYGETAVGHVEAVRNKLGPVWEKLLADDVEIVFQDPASIIVREKERKDEPPVDGNGRFIFRNIRTTHTDAKWDYGFDESILPSYSEVLERHEHAFERKDFISAQEFEDRAERKKIQILAGPYANLFKGRHTRPFAIALPQMAVPKKGGLGELLARTIIPAAKRGYARQYPERSFNDFLGDSLIGYVEVFAGNRQKRFIAALAKGPQVLWVFMNCLQGGSINADRDLIASQAEEYMLGGTLVNAPVIGAYPEVVAASSQNPLYYCAADIFRRGDSLYLDPFGDNVDFDDWGGLGDCLGSYSASVAMLA